MPEKSASVTLMMDPLNPALFFACCGLFELASDFMPACMAAFRHNPQLPRQAEFEISGVDGLLLTEVLTAARQAKPITVGTEDGETPVELVFPGSMRLTLDWWLLPDRSRKSRFKLWAGQQTTLKLVEDMLGASWGELGVGILRNRIPMSGRFGVDPRSSWNTLDFGSSLNLQAPDPYTYPATEFLAAIGLQGFRPRQAGSGFSYRLWEDHLPLNIARVAAAVPLPSFSGHSFIFQVEKRSGSYSSFTFAITA